MKHLNWFLGPKGENSEFFIDSITSILQDYIHWRRNYYPSDKILINNKMQRDNIGVLDNIHLDLMEMMSQLRRDFPFYSPRYIGHMLSDVTIPSTLGYIAGMLHNSNNVTPEAAPVTVEWEIDACNRILEMIGFTPSPTPPTIEGSIDDWKTYQKKLKGEFGWSHITSGGTVANIEALWVARLVKYYPLSIQDVAIKEKLDIDIKLPDHSIQDIKKVSKFDIVNIKTNESIYLFSRFISALSKNKDISISEANKLSSKLLGESKYSLANNLGGVFNEFPPVIFCSGAAHYSVKKAADILGIGRSNVIIVKTDSQFRLDVDDLELKIESALKSKKIPIAVIAVAATTEEGAVDPIHRIIDLRDKLEERNRGFWLHIDAAWGGYISSIFKIDAEDELESILRKIGSKLKLSFPENIDIQDTIIEIVDITINKTSQPDSTSDIEKKNKAIEIFTNRLNDLKHNIFNDVVGLNDFIRNYKKIAVDFGNTIYFDNDVKLMDLFREEDFILTIADRSDLISNYVSDKINFSLNGKRREKTIKWGGKPTVSSFMAFKYADSITVDPHKLGYIQYPCGVISFRNDRVRHFIMQRAPYITSSGYNALLHNPPRHLNNIDFDKIEHNELPYENYDVAIDAFAPFMLEGSKPGAAAAALWFSTKIIPLNRKNHGYIIKESMIASRELYEWLFTWEKIYKDSSIPESLLYDFKTFGNPDTNVVVFVVKSKVHHTIKDMNDLTTEVYKKFTIQAELGSRTHSYSQSFFISKTTMDGEHYDFESFKPFFSNCDLRNAKKDYQKHGLVVLRATVMNPYIAEIRRTTKQNLIKEFIWELHKTTNEACKKIMRN
jgi:glutamate/tyrosine decarboxylase-like PLP-dependent enzyme